MLTATSACRLRLPRHSPACLFACAACLALFTCARAPRSVCGASCVPLPASSMPRQLPALFLARAGLPFALPVLAVWFGRNHRSRCARAHCRAQPISPALSAPPLLSCAPFPPTLFRTPPHLLHREPLYTHTHSRAVFSTTSASLRAARLGLYHYLSPPLHPHLLHAHSHA